MPDGTRYHSRMIPLIRALFSHQAWADAAMWNAVRHCEAAAGDESLRTTLHHIVVVQRAFLSKFLDQPFDHERASRLPESLTTLAPLFRETHAAELAFVDGLEEADLSRVIALPWIPRGRPSVAEALTQVVMHSQNHRGQCAARLRALGATPPMTDFIIWLTDRPTPVWK